MIKNDKTNKDEKYKRFEKIHDKIKFKAFGKVTIRQRRIPKDKLEVVGKDRTEWLRKEAEGKRKCEKIMRETFGKKHHQSPKTKLEKSETYSKLELGWVNLRKMLKFKI